MVFCLTWLCQKRASHIPFHHFQGTEAKEAEEAEAVGLRLRGRNGRVGGGDRVVLGRGVGRPEKEEGDAQEAQEERLFRRR